VTATPTATITPTPTATSTPIGLCGNSQLDPGETCDPPGVAFPPTDNLCRDDCTFCGDGITQPNADPKEICDDGNGVSGCRPDKPQKPLDGCLNNCQEPACEDPSRIQLYPELDRYDVIQVHGRLITTTDVDFKDGDFRIKISRRVCSHDSTVLCGTDQECDALAAGSTCEASVVFDQILPGQDLQQGTTSRWRYRNALAKTAGGVYLIKITGKADSRVCASGPNDGAKCTTAADCPTGACVGYYGLKLKAYGDAATAVSDMQTQIYAGGHGWAVRGLWLQQSKSWRLNKTSVLLQPWS
jgi:hypothetical protein